MKKFLLAWGVYVVLTFAIAASWHLAIFKEVYDHLGIYTRKEPIIALGVLTMVIQGTVMAYLYPLYYRGGKPLRQGALFGVIMGAFLGSYAVLADAAKNEVSSLSTWIALESVYYILQFAVVGAAIGLIYGEKK